MRAIHLVALVALVVAVAGAGCNHITTRVPGVLDLRSDGSEVPVDSSPPKAESRGGFDSLLWGDGVQGAGNVTIVDRKYWIFRIISIGNDSATEEINAATGPDGALRNVVIGEQFTLGDLGVHIGGSCVMALVPFIGSLVAGAILPPLDVKLSATRIKPQAAPAAEAASPTDEPAPPPATGEE